MKQRIVLSLLLACSSIMHAQVVRQPGIPDHAAAITWQTDLLGGPPGKVAGLSGYHNTVPLAWTPITSDSLLGYDIYKSASSAGTFNRSARLLQNCYYRDEPVGQAALYYYKIKSVYTKSESGFSDAANGQEQENGYVIRSAFADAAPTLDGVINSAEWSRAQMVDILYPGLTGIVRLYVMSDAHCLYLAVDDRKSSKLDNSDCIGIFFDRDMDREWSNEAKAEGLVQIYWENGVAKNRFIPFHGKWPNKLSSESAVVVTGITQGFSLTNGHVQTEISINLDLAPFNLLPFAAMGFLIYVYDGANGQFYGAWPQEAPLKLPAVVKGYAWAHGPFAYGDLVLSSSAPADFWADVDQDHDVDIMDIQLVAGRWGADRYAANYLPVYDVNSDGFIDIFDIQLVAFWWNKTIPLARSDQGIALKATQPLRIEIRHASEKVYELWVTGAQELAAFQVECASAKPMQIEKMELGGFLSTSGNTILSLPVHHSTGGLTGTVAAFSYGIYKGASGAGKLAELVFENNSKLEFDIKCADKSGRLLAVEQVMIDNERSLQQIDLLQNFPNPFNATTVITFLLTGAAKVTMDVFNANGQIVESKELGKLNAGVLCATWDGKEYASGVYFCRISTSNSSKLLKFMLMR